MQDEVVRTIIKRVPPSSPALLPNYHRFNIKGRIYPAILPVQSKKVAGKVITGVTDAELQILDEFEDVEYVRTRVEISLTDTSETMLADTYVWADAEDPNLYGEWDFEVRVFPSVFIPDAILYIYKILSPCYFVSSSILTPVLKLSSCLTELIKLTVVITIV